MQNLIHPNLETQKSTQQTVSSSIIFPPIYAEGASINSVNLNLNDRLYQLGPSSFCMPHMIAIRRSITLTWNVRLPSQCNFYDINSSGGREQVESLAEWMTVGLICIKSGTQILRKGGAKRAVWHARMAKESERERKRKNEHFAPCVKKRLAQPTTQPTHCRRAGGGRGQPPPPAGPRPPPTGGWGWRHNSLTLSLSHKRRPVAAEAPVEDGSPARGAPQIMSRRPPLCDQLSKCAPQWPPPHPFRHVRARSIPPVRTREAVGWVSKQSFACQFSALCCAADTKCTRCSPCRHGPHFGCTLHFWWVHFFNFFVSDTFECKDK